jgi:ribonuclease P protein component
MWRKGSLSGSHAFRRVLRTGRRIRREALTVYLRERSGPSRLGLIVALSPRSAVTRNRIRRRLRGAARLAVPASGWDVVVKADASVAACDFQELVRGLADAVHKVALPQ